MGLPSTSEEIDSQTSNPGGVPEVVTQHGDLVIDVASK